MSQPDFAPSRGAPDILEQTQLTTDQARTEQVAALCPAKRAFGSG